MALIEWQVACSALGQDKDQKRARGSNPLSRPPATMKPALQSAFSCFREPGSICESTPRLRLLLCTRLGASKQHAQTAAHLQRMRVMCWQRQSEGRGGALGRLRLYLALPVQVQRRRELMDGI